jgi:DNA-damage-inducible protein J
MNKSAVVHARIDSSVKKEAESVFNRLGLTPTEAVRLFYTQVSLSQGIPFSLHIPNEATAKVLEDSRKGIGIKKYDSLNSLFSSWDDQTD